MLGMMYESGEDVPINNVEAYARFSVARGVNKLSRALNAAKGDFQPFDRHTSQPNRCAVDDGKASAIVLTGT